MADNNYHSRLMNCFFQLIESQSGQNLFRCRHCRHEHWKAGDDPPKKNCEEAFLDCRYRGEVIRQEACTTCAGGRGTLKDVYACDIHGECVKRQITTPANMMDCVRCEKRRPATFPRVKQPQCNVIAVTSLSVSERTRDALETWKNAGLSIVAMQPRDEMASVQAEFGDLVDEWRTVDQDARWTFGRPCVFIHDMAKLAKEFNQTIMLINSDIEIHGDQQRLIDATDADILTIGTRHEYSDWRQTVLNHYGLDVFFISPRMASLIPDIGLCIGMPWWDYMVPKTAIMHGIPVDIIEEPLFFHRRHELNWNHEHWIKAARMLMNAGYEFGLENPLEKVQSYEAARKFRESLRRVHA